MSIGAALDAKMTSLLSVFVTAKAAAVASAIAPVALTAVTIYIMTIGFAVVRGDVQDPMSTLIARVMRMAIVAGVALSIGEYGNVVVNGVMALQSGLVAAMGGASSVGGLIDTMTDPYTKLVEALMSAGTAGLMPKFSLILAAVIVAVAQAILFPIALGMYLLAKVGLALLLAVGPIFVACALFPATQRFTESWISATLSMVLTSVLLAACIGMVTTLAGQFATAVLAQVGATAFLADVVALLLLSVALVVVLLNVPVWTRIDPAFVRFVVTKLTVSE